MITAGDAPSTGREGEGPDGIKRAGKAVVRERARTRDTGVVALEALSRKRRLEKRSGRAAPATLGVGSIGAVDAERMASCVREEYLHRGKRLH